MWERLELSRRLIRLGRARPAANRQSYPYAIMGDGEVSEWFMVPLSKSGVLARGPWVRIPPSPPSSKLPARTRGLVPGAH